MNYDKVVLLTEEARENLAKLSDDELSGIAKLIAGNVRQTEIRINQEILDKLPKSILNELIEKIRRES